MRQVMKSLNDAMSTTASALNSFPSVTKKAAAIAEQRAKQALSLTLLGLKMVRKLHIVCFLYTDVHFQVIKALGTFDNRKDYEGFAK